MTIDSDTRTVWRIDPRHTLVEFAVTYLALTTVKGRFTGVSGTIRADEAEAEPSSVEVEIDAASIETSEARRDTHLRSADFLDVERFPTITFVSTRVERVEPDRLLVYGDLTIRDLTQTVALDTRINGRSRTPDGQEVAGFTAQAQIRRQDFGLTWNRTLETGAVMVGDTVKLQFEVQAVLQG